MPKLDWSPFWVCYDLRTKAVQSPNRKKLVCEEVMISYQCGVVNTLWSSRHTPLSVGRQQR